MAERETLEVLRRLRGGLIVSVQADADSLLNTPETISLLARCVARNGARGLRVEGHARIAAVRAAVDLPIIGIVKHAYPGFEPYITSTHAEVEMVADAGADIVAFDATDRERVTGAGVADLVRSVHARGLIAMADCAEPADLARAVEAGADIVATTLAGYTKKTRGRTLPAYDLVSAFAARHDFTICEGGIATPALAREAFEAGAAAIVVGTAITNVDALVRSFVAASVVTGDAGRAV